MHCQPDRANAGNIILTHDGPPLEADTHCVHARELRRALFDRIEYACEPPRAAMRRDFLSTVWTAVAAVVLVCTGTRTSPSVPP